MENMIEQHDLVGDYTIDFGGLIQNIGKNLYSSPEMTIREMAQNGHDSIVKRQMEEPSHVGRIDIHVDRGLRLLEFTDDGIGMTGKEIRDYLCTIGRSGTREFREKNLRENRSEAGNTIGTFGIGMFSAFVVAERVYLETRSIHEDETAGWRWIPSEGSSYKLQRIHRTKPGTTIKIILKKEYLRLTNSETIRDAIKKWADFLPIPIYINNDGPVNTINPPWIAYYATEKERIEAYYDLVNSRYPREIPLEVIPIDLEVPHPVKGVLFISDRRLPDGAGTVDIYQKRIFVCQAHQNILPEWATFIKGVIDSPAFNLTLARDAIRHDTVLHDICDALGQVILDSLTQLAKEDPGRFRRLIRWHHYQIKEMALKFDDFFDVIADLILFEVSTPNDESSEEPYKMMTIPEYLQLQGGENNKQTLYYISQEGSAPQFYQLCQARGIHAINAGSLYDEKFLLKYVGRYPVTLGLERIDIGRSEMLFRSLNDEERKPFISMEYYLQNQLKEIQPDLDVLVRTESFDPPTIPAVLTQTRDSETSDRLKYLETHPGIPDGILRDLIREVRGYKMSAALPTILHLNAKNSLVQSLKSCDFNDGVIKDLLLTLYANAFLYSGQQITPNHMKFLTPLAMRLPQHVMNLLRNTQSPASTRREVTPRTSAINEVTKKNTQLRNESVAIVKD